MRGVNLVIAIGTLGADPELRDAGGSPVCTCSIAVNESWTDKATGERKESTEWIRLVFWRRLAEIASEYLSKGSRVYIEGKMKTRKWQDQSGQDRYMTEVLVNNMQMLGDKTASSQGTSAPPTSPQFDQRPGTDNPPRNHDFPDDEIPF